MLDRVEVMVRFPTFVLFGCGCRPMLDRAKRSSLSLPCYVWLLLLSANVSGCRAGMRDDMTVLNLADAMGIGAFCCIGAQAGVRKVLR